MQKRFAILCIILIFLSTLVVAFHHHNDGIPHNDCPICLAVHNSSSATHEGYEVQRSNDVIISHLEVPFALPSTASLPSNNRAPPA
jgi:hypothetical protein